MTFSLLLNLAAVVSISGTVACVPLLLHPYLQLGVHSTNQRSIHPSSIAFLQCVNLFLIFYYYYLSLSRLCDASVTSFVPERCALHVASRAAADAYLNGSAKCGKVYAT